MIKFPVTLLPCALRTEYSLTSESAVTRAAPIKGRSRHELKDMHPTHNLSFQWLMDQSQFNVWQGFWAATGYGEDWFEMTVVLDTPSGRPMAVHAKEPWSGTVDGVDHWTVSLQAEGVVL